MPTRRRFALAVALALVVAASGCVSGPLSEQQEDRLADRVESDLDAVDAYEATVVTDVSYENQSLDARRRVKADVEAGATWQKTLAPAERAGDLLVANGSTTWQYDASENAVTRYRSGGYSGLLSNVSRLFTGLTERYDVTVNGTETVTGTETRVVELTPDDNGSAVAERSMTVWLDTSTRFPVKVRQSIDTEETTIETTTRYENVTLNPGFEPGAFDYEPPADAEVDAVELPETRQFDGESELRNAAEQSVASPELPDGFSFDRGTVLEDGANETVMLTYGNGSASVSVSQRPAGAYGADGEQVTVGGHDATLSTYGDTALVTWRCEGVRYSTTSTAGEALARSVAATIDCR